MSVIGHFRDLDRPDHFVWLRGFADMATRLEGLTAFYGSPGWLAARGDANAEIIDNDDVLLLKPAHPGAGFLPPVAPRPPMGADASEAVMVVLIVHLQPGEDGARLGSAMAPLRAQAGAAPLATLVTEPAANTFPRLPVREGEQVLVQVARLANPAGADALLAAVQGLASGKVEMLRLEPCPRSTLR